jgi:CRISPR-associated protein Cas6
MSYVDVQFSVQGDRIPADHGYFLFSAVSRLVPELHGDDQVGIHAISGRYVGDRLLAIDQRSRLTIRLFSDRIGEIIGLAGKDLILGNQHLGIGVPNTRALPPAARLYSRLVVIKGFLDPESFLDAVRRQLNQMEVKGEPSLVSVADAVKANENRKGGTRSPWLRRTLRIRDKEVVGFAVRVDGLSAESSILIQEKGVGGRRRFGCGIFIPAKE